MSFFNRARDAGPTYATVTAWLQDREHIDAQLASAEGADSHHIDDFALPFDAVLREYAVTRDLVNTPQYNYVFTVSLPALYWVSDESDINLDEIDALMANPNYEPPELSITPYDWNGEVLLQNQDEYAYLTSVEFKRYKDLGLAFYYAVRWYADGVDQPYQRSLFVFHADTSQPWIVPTAAQAAAIEVAPKNPLMYMLQKPGFKEFVISEADGAQGGLEALYFEFLRIDSLAQGLKFFEECAVAIELFRLDTGMTLYVEQFLNVLPHKNRGPVFPQYKFWRAPWGRAEARGKNDWQERSWYSKLFVRSERVSTDGRFNIHDYTYYSPILRIGRIRTFMLA